jgi:Zn-dependent protease
MMHGSFRVFRIAGFDIYINISWLIIIVFLTASLALSWFPALDKGWSTAEYWIVGFISSILLFVAVLLHELAHSLVARARGLPVSRITLYIFGGVSDLEQEPQSPGAEFQMAFVGPLVSILIGIVAFLILIPLRSSNSPLAAILEYLFITNILLGIFNLLPGFPLDGGRVLRSIIWRATGSLSRATHIAAIVGRILAFLFILAGIYLFFLGDVFDGIWIGFIGWFLLNAAQSSEAQTMLQTVLRGVTVRQVMNTTPTTVPANISLQKLVNEYFLPQGLRSALVLQGDQLAGLVTLADIRHIPQDQWSQTPVGFIMIPLEKLHTVTPEQDLNHVLPLMTGQDVNQLPVVDQGRLLGVVTRDAILRYIEIHRNLNTNQVSGLRQ